MTCLKKIFLFQKPHPIIGVKTGPYKEMNIMKDPDIMFDEMLPEVVEQIEELPVNMTATWKPTKKIKPFDKTTKMQPKETTKQKHQKSQTTPGPIVTPTDKRINENKQIGPSSAFTDVVQTTTKKTTENEFLIGLPKRLSDTMPTSGKTTGGQVKTTAGTSKKDQEADDRLARALASMNRLNNNKKYSFQTGKKQAKYDQEMDGRMERALAIIKKLDNNKKYSFQN